MKTEHTLIEVKNVKKIYRDEGVETVAVNGVTFNIDKGEFAQALATKLVLSNEIISVPEYIRKAIIWACGGNPDES